MIKEVDIDEIISVLENRGIFVMTYAQRQDGEESLNKISKYMGDRYSSIQTIYVEIKKALGSAGGNFSLNMRGYKQEIVSDSTQLCTILYEMAMLSEYNYKKSPIYQIHGRVNRNPKVINYLTGHWLEDYVRIVVLEEIQRLNNKIEYSYLLNPQIKLPNGNDFELDDVFLINGVLYWIEAKNGAYQDYISKYSGMMKILNVSSERSFLVSGMLSANDRGELLSRFYGMRVVSIEQFRQALRRQLQMDFAVPEEL